MTIYGDDKDKVLDYIKDAQAHDIQVVAPDVNLAERDFSVIDNHTIMYGFDSVKGLPERGVEAIMTKRPFKDLYDIVDRSVKSEINKSSVDRLVWSGALDKLHGKDRLDTLKKFYQARGDGRLNDDLPETIDKRELLDREKDLLGIYLTEHPLDAYDETIDWNRLKETQQRVNVHGLIVGRRVIKTKKGDDMAFVDIEFKDEYINGVMFPQVYSKKIVRRAGSKETSLGHFLKEGVIVKVSAYFSEDNRGGLSFIIADMTIPVRINEIKEDELKEIEETYGQEVVEPEEEPTIQMPPSRPLHL